MAKINNELLDSIGSLKEIVWQVNMIIKSKRDAILLRQVYAKCISSWTKKINERRITRKIAKENATCFRLAGYTNPVENMEEDLLVNLLESFETGAYQLVLLVSDQELSLIQMPLLIEALKGVEKNLNIIDEWSNP